MFYDVLKIELITVQDVVVSVGNVQDHDSGVGLYETLKLTIWDTGLEGVFVPSFSPSTVIVK